MNANIFGYTFEDIQAMQNGTYKRPTINGAPTKPVATKEDYRMLGDMGWDGLVEKEYYGVIDRLSREQVTD